MSDLKLDEFQPTPDLAAPIDGIERSAATLGAACGQNEAQASQWVARVARARAELHALAGDVLTGVDTSPVEDLS